MISQDQIKELVSLSKPHPLLYIEDNGQLRVITKNLLMNFFDTIDTAENGFEGLELFEEKKYPIIITDLQMPLMDGTQMISEIRKQDPDQIIIVTSAYDDSKNLLNMIHLNIDYFLRKPIESDQLYSILFKAVKQIHFRNLDKHYKIQLEETVKQRTSELTQAYEKLKSLNILKDDFLETISHELLTPLTSIMGYTEILIEMEVDKQKHDSIVSVIMEESENLLSLIKNVLDLTNIKSGISEYKFEKCSLKDIIDNIVKIMNDQFTNNKKPSIEVEDLIKNVLIFCDKERLSQALKNILANSIQYSPENSIISISFKSQKKGICVTISDQGVGIPTDQLKNVFQKFFKIQIPGFEIKGTGIGLAISQGIIEAHQGKIWAEESEIGARISFLLPCTFQC